MFGLKQQNISCIVRLLNTEQTTNPLKKRQKFSIYFDLNHLIECLWVLSTFSITMNHTSNQSLNTFNIFTNFSLKIKFWRIWVENHFAKKWEMTSERMVVWEQSWNRRSAGLFGGLLYEKGREGVGREERGIRVVLEKREE